MDSVSQEERCLQFDVCRLCGLYKVGGKRFCILHYPEANKTLEQFNAAITAHLQAGRSDFRYVHFHKEAAPPFQGVEFPGLADFRNAVFPTEIQLGQGRFPKGLILVTEQLASIDLKNAIMDGSTQIEVGKVTASIHLIGAHLNGELSIKAKQVGMVDLLDATVGGRVKLKIDDVKNVRLTRSKISYGLTFASTAKQQIHLELSSATIGGPVNIEVYGANTSAAYAKFSGQVSIQTHDPQQVNFGWADLSKPLVLRGRIGANFSMATIREGLDFQGCTIDGTPNFEGTKFDAASELDLRNTVVRGDLRIIGSPTGPKTIQLGGSKIEGSTTIETELGAHPTGVVARDRYPQFGGDVVLINVDFSSCKLVGSAIHRFNFTNVKWARR